MSGALYTGMRWGELAALTTGQINQAARVIDVDRKVIEICGKQYVEAPKGRKGGARSTPAAPPAATSWQRRSRPGSRKPAPGRKPAPTRWG